MKKNREIAFICILACIIALIVPASASSTRASDQIKGYMMDTIVTRGAINIEFSITGKVIMSKIGCERSEERRVGKEC